MLLVGVLGLGFGLIAGQRYVPDFIMMWFASPQAYVMQWREAIVVAVAVIISLYTYGSYWLARALAIPLAIICCWGGVEFFWAHSSYIFDSLFIMAAGVWAAATALQASGRLEAEGTPAWPVEPAQAWRRARLYHRPYGLSALLYRANIRDDSHVLVLH